MSRYLIRAGPRGLRAHRDGPAHASAAAAGVEYPGRVCGGACPRRVREASGRGDRRAGRGRWRRSILCSRTPRRRGADLSRHAGGPRRVRSVRVLIQAGLSATVESGVTGAVAGCPSTYSARRQLTGGQLRSRCYRPWFVARTAADTADQSLVVTSQAHAPPVNRPTCLKLCLRSERSRLFRGRNATGAGTPEEHETLAMRVPGVFRRVRAWRRTGLRRPLLYPN